MTRRPSPRVLPLLLVLTLPAVAGATDLIIKERQTFDGMGMGPTTKDATQYSAGNKRVTDGPDTRVIVDLDARTFTVANKQSKTYWTRSLDELKQRAEDGRKRLAEMPEQARKALEAMMGDGDVTITPTGKSEKIAGYTAKEFKLASPRVSGTLWVTEELADPVGTRAAQAFSDAVGGSAGPGGALATALGKVKGMPLRTTITMKAGPQTVTTTSEVLEVIQKTAPSDVLGVPAGFTKQEPPPVKVPAPQGAPAAPPKP